MAKPAIDQTVVAKATALGPVIREHAAEAEQERRQSKPVIAALTRSGLTSMFLPQSLGGLETSPLPAMRVVEEISSFDSVAGWLLMVSNAGAWAASRLPARTVEEMYRDLDDCLQATAFQPPVEAREAPGGYRLTGRRPFASGAHAARWISLTAMVMDGPQPKMVGGMPQIICAVMPASSAEVIDTWYGLGLRGSDSNDVSVRDLFVATEWTFALSPVLQANAHYGSPLYRLPMLAAIPYALIAPIATAVARNAIDAIKAQCARRVPMGSAVPLRERGVAQEKLGRAEGMLRAARALMYDAMADAWERIVAGETLTLQDKADLLLAATHTVQTSTEVTDMMFSLGGSSAVFAGNPLERLFRDANVLRQHGFVSAARFETAAQVTLGLPPDLALLHF